MDKLKTSAFVSQTYGRRIRTVEVQSQRKKPTGGGSMKGLLTEVLLGIAACSALLYVSLNQAGLLEQSKRQLQDALTYQVSYDDAMGSLQFVKDGAAEVFGIRSQLGVPVRELNDVEQNDNRGVTLQCASESEVYCSADGEVTKVSAHSITVSAQTLATTYGELSFVCAEVGQIVRRGEVLGRASKDGALTLQVTQDGQLVDVMEMLGIEHQ